MLKCSNQEHMVSTRQKTSLSFYIAPFDLGLHHVIDLHVPFFWDLCWIWHNQSHCGLDSWWCVITFFLHNNNKKLCLWFIFNCTIRIQLHWFFNHCCTSVHGCFIKLQVTMATVFLLHLQNKTNHWKRRKKKTTEIENLDNMKGNQWTLLNACDQVQQ